MRYIGLRGGNRREQMRRVRRGKSREQYKAEESGEKRKHCPMLLMDEGSEDESKM